jgi:hypothetical protein
MRLNRFFLYLLPLTGVFLLAGALRGPRSRPERDLPRLPAELSNLALASPDPGSAKLVEQAVARLSDPAHPWLKTSLWMRMHLPELRFTAEGTYVKASGHRYRLEMRTRLDQGKKDRSSGSLVLAVCDGRDLWQAMRFGERDYTNVVRLRVDAILNAPDGPATQPVIRYEFLHGHALRGIETLLRNVQVRMWWVHRETQADREVLTGVWTPPMRASLSPAGQPWPAALPRLCRLHLAGAARWPGRIEWWGPTADRGPDRLLAEMEFRDPVFDRVLSEEECSRLFRFNPGKAEVQDITPQVRSDLTTRVKQLAPAKR